MSVVTHTELPRQIRHAMDIKREPPRRRRRYVLGGGAVAGVLILSLAIGRLRPAAPSVDSASLVIDTVRRSDMTLDVRAPGTLVPEHVRILAAATAGRVESLPIRPGATVTPNTTVVLLSNTDVELQAMQSEQQLSAAMSSLAGLRTALRQQRLSQEGIVAQTVTQAQDAQRSVAVFESLDRKQLAAANEVAAARDKARELGTRLDLERRRLQDVAGSEREQLALMQDQVARLREIVAAQRRRVTAMRVVAGESGQLQVLPLELGQWVNPGMELARIAQPGRLKAVLRVPDVQARDIALGQRAVIDTRSGIVSGHVQRTDPSSQNGTVTVEVALDGVLPAGTRSDLGVDGTIEIARLTNVLHVGRPPYGDPGASVGLFKVGTDGKDAVRVPVKLGRASANAVQIVHGLAAGDRVIISDMSSWDNVSRMRIR
ncbi:MAG: efflux RND transporter periplasmic adaptor subunit [Gemmatimonadaceae bacterium]